MLKVNLLCFFSLLLTSWLTIAANIRFQVEGLSGELEKNVRAQLLRIEPNDNEIISERRFRARVNNTICNALKALGYYEPIIDFDFIPLPNKKQQVVFVHISPGNPVLISGKNVILRGDARMDHDYLNLISTSPKVGTVLNHGNYEKFKKNLINIAMRKGYFDNHFIINHLLVDVKQRQAFWNIDYDSGIRYRFDEVSFEGSQIHKEYLKNLIPFKTGDYYQSSTIGEINRRLSNTGWFKSVVVAASEDNQFCTKKTLPLHVVVSPSAENIIETGIGYSTDVGEHIKGMWKKPWMNCYGHSLSSNINISTIEQQLNFIYKIPLKKNSLEQYYLLKGGFKRSDIHNVEQDSTTLAVSYHWNFSNNWQRWINLRWSLDHFTHENVTNTSMLLYPSIKIVRTRVRGTIIPIWGDSQGYSIDYSNSIWGSDVDFFVMQAKNVWIRTFNNKHRFVIRGNLGWIETNAFSRVPPDLRFFAGGDHSIRGYKYKSISLKNAKGQLIGASKLATGSLEYHLKVTEKWWTAIFVDAGEAVNHIRNSNFKKSMGIGVRWQSPIGAIKVDFAFPMGNQNKHYLQFYIGLGPELL